MKKYKIEIIENGFSKNYYVKQRLKILFWYRWFYLVDGWGSKIEFDNVEKAKEYIAKQLIPTTVETIYYP